MKKLILLFSLFIFSYVFCNAQNPYNESISFSYVRNPLQPLPKEFKTYSVVANVVYAEDVARQSEEWKQEKVEMIEENKTEKKEYKEQGVGKKILERALLDEKKPKNILIDEKYFSKVYNASDISSKIKFDGYQFNETSDLKLEVILNGFEYIIEDDFTEKTKDGVITKTFRYKITYKHSIEIKLIDDAGNVLDHSEMAGLKSFKTQSTKKFKLKYLLEKYWNENNISYLRKLDEKVTYDNLKVINNYLNSQFGYSTVKKTSSIAMVKPKKYDYDEYFNAYEQIFTGYNYLVENIDEAATYIKEAINYWETALKESDKDNKKARINAKVTAVTHLNCVEAYCWLNDYQNARRHIMKIKMMKSKKYDKRVEGCQKFIEDQEKRFKASKEI